MNYSIIPLEIELPKQACLLNLSQLYHSLSLLPDKRKARGKLYPLALLLTVAILAKLADQNQIRAVAHWAKLRQHQLAQLFGLKRATMPHHTTWSRVLGGAVEPAALTKLVAGFLAQRVQGPGQIPARASLILAIDGKTLRGTIPLGQTRGVHLVAAYLPAQGVVLAQIAVEVKQNEIVVAPKVLANIDLRGMVVVGDAMFCQRELSVQIVGRGGDYLWIVKGNQKGVLEDIELLFEEPPVAPGCSPLPTDFEEYEQWEKGHGRLERRKITTSALLAGYTPWPHLAQVFKLESWRTAANGKTSYEVRYGLTSLEREVADGRRLLSMVRGEWGIENKLHYRRDVTLGEDQSQLRQGVGPEVNAILNSTVLGLLDQAGVKNVAEARREFAYHFHQQLFSLVS